MSKQHITIVGGGLVGALSAAFFAKRGDIVEVFEKRGDPRVHLQNSLRSINLVITYRGIGALKELGLWEEVQGLCVPVRGRFIHPLQGEEEFQPYGIKPHHQNYSVSRSQLNAFLIEKAISLGATFHFGSGVVGVDFANQSLMIKTKGSPHTHPYEFLLGTDGIGSQVRKALEEQMPPPNPSRIEDLGVSYKEILLPFAPNGEALLDFQSLHIWPRGEHMLMGLPNLDKSFTMTLYLPDQGDVGREDLTSSTGVKSYFNTYYNDVIPLIPDLHHQFEDHPMGKLATLYCDQWTREGNVLLLGDASHGIVPFFGQGMNAGFEDVYLLMKELQKVPLADLDLQQFAKERKIDTDAIAQMAIENYREMSDHVGQARFLLKKRLERYLERERPYYQSRYALVVFSDIPYREALQLGELQKELLEEFVGDAQSFEEIGLDHVLNKLDEVYEPRVRSLA